MSEEKIIKMNREGGEGSTDPRERLRVRIEFIKELRNVIRSCYQKAETDGEKLLIEAIADCMDADLQPGPKKSDAEAPKA